VKDPLLIYDEEEEVLGDALLRPAEGKISATRRWGGGGIRPGNEKSCVKEKGTLNLAGKEKERSLAEGKKGRNGGGGREAYRDSGGEELFRGFN